MVEQREVLPGYYIDSKGLYTDISEGRFRPIDIVDGLVVVQPFRPHLERLLSGYRYRRLKIMKGGDINERRSNTR